ncbi:MAG: hypothetical protein NTY50_13705 [Methylobacter sp.]|nr:hypothetical protein [Methylobacter sp.]
MELGNCSCIALPPASLQSTDDADGADLKTYSSHAPAWEFSLQRSSVAVTLERYNDAIVLFSGTRGTPILRNAVFTSALSIDIQLLPGLPA